jgi:hypothetical protein
LATSEKGGETMVRNFVERLEAKIQGLDTAQLQTMIDLCMLEWCRREDEARAEVEAEGRVIKIEAGQ